MSKPNTLVRVFSAIWGGANAIRKVLHLVLLLVIFFAFIGVLSGGAPPSIPKKAALIIKPSGTLVEQLAGSPLDRAIDEATGSSEPQTLVKDIVDALEYAKDDDRIHAVYLNVSNVFGSGLTKLQRVADAIEDFKSSGKPVIATGDTMMQAAYYLAAHADEVYLHPDGFVWLPGYGMYRSYYKNAIDLLKIDWNVFRVGTHKSFVEPYTRTDMSDEDRETRTRLVEQLWTIYKEGVEAARGLDVGAVQAYAENMLENLGAAGGDAPTAAVNLGLVDELRTRIEVRERMIELVGEHEDRADTFAAAGMYDYLAQMRMMDGEKSADENVAVVMAVGSILDGSQPPGAIGGDSTAELLRRARNDESVKAVVLRVDSGGGSAFASEVIGNEIRALRAAGKPVIASMSTVAASGGYWISMDTDKIFAAPATITGSIGILGMLPTFQRTLATIGITNDGVGTTPLSDALRADRAMSDEAKTMFQVFIEDGYDDFISGVAEGRGMDKAEVDKVAQGQVWMAGDALEFGLVDELGELEDAVAAAAELAGLDEWGTTTIEPELSPMEQLIVDLLDASARIGIEASFWVDKPSAIEEVAGSVLERSKQLLQFNDPKGMYSLCFCEDIR